MKRNAGFLRKAKTLCPVMGRGFFNKSLTMTYFHKRIAHYHRRRGVSRSCSGWEGVVPPRYGHQAQLVRSLALITAGKKPNLEEAKRYYIFAGVIAANTAATHALLNPTIQGYRIKPHGQLVSVSLTHYCASTPDLSTSWSRTTL